MLVTQDTSTLCVALGKQALEFGHRRAVKTVVSSKASQSFTVTLPRAVSIGLPSKACSAPDPM